MSMFPDKLLHADELYELESSGLAHVDSLENEHMETYGKPFSSFDWNKEYARFWNDLDAWKRIVDEERASRYLENGANCYE